MTLKKWGIFSRHPVSKSRCEGHIDSRIHDHVSSVYTGCCHPVLCGLLRNQPVCTVSHSAGEAVQWVMSENHTLSVLADAGLVHWFICTYSYLCLHSKMSRKFIPRTPFLSVPVCLPHPSEEGHCPYVLQPSGKAGLRWSCHLLNSWDGLSDENNFLIGPYTSLSFEYFVYNEQVCSGSHTFLKNVITVIEFPCFGRASISQ
jgi:hypothetical protein